MVPICSKIVEFGYGLLILDLVLQKRSFSFPFLKYIMRKRSYVLRLVFLGWESDATSAKLLSR